MIVKGSCTVGGVSYQFEADEKDAKESLNQVLTLSNPPLYCDVCQNSDPTRFKMTTNKDNEGNIYVNVQCVHAGCFAKCKLGTYKNGGYFWRKPYEKYEPKNKTGEAAAPAGTPWDKDFPNKT